MQSTLSYRKAFFGLALAAGLALGLGACAQAGDDGREEAPAGEQPQALDTASVDNQPDARDESFFPVCGGYGTCYCFCRYRHRCDLNSAECGPLADCLYGCDAQYPNCPYPPGGTFPDQPGQCF